MLKLSQTVVINGDDDEFGGCRVRVLGGIEGCKGALEVSIEALESIGIRKGDQRTEDGQYEGKKAFEGRFFMRGENERFVGVVGAGLHRSALYLRNGLILATLYLRKNE